MVPSPDGMSAPGWRRALSNLRFGPGLSIALHVVLVYSVSRAAWETPQISGRSPPTVVWLNDWRPQRVESVVSAVFPPAPEISPNDVVEESRAVIVEQPSLPDEAREPAPDRATPETQPRTEDVEPGLPPALTPNGDDPARDVRPSVDWEAQRRQAAESVVQEREREEGYRSFSLDDVDELAPREEPSPPTAIAEVIKDKCVVATSNFKRRALAMFGICARLPRGDLFADIKPEYLKKRAVCVETRPGEPTVMDARGNEISTVKCELIAEDEYAGIPLE